MSVMPTVETKPSLDLDPYDIFEADDDFFGSHMRGQNFFEAVQIDRQMMKMTDSVCTQIPVMIDHFTKYAEKYPV